MLRSQEGILISHAKVHNTHLILQATSQMKSSKFHISLPAQVDVEESIYSLSKVLLQIPSCYSSL